jgi:hypothetical protein
MTSVAALPQSAVPNTATSSAPLAAAAKVARAADGDFKTKGVGHEVKDADGDYKPTNSAASKSASATLSALTSMRLGG